MKIRVTLVIDMDEGMVDEWREDNDVERGEVRADVRSYVLTAIQGAAQLDGRADVSLVP